MASDMAFSVPPQPVIQAASVELKPYILTWFFRRIRCNPKVRKFSSEAENMGQAKAHQEMSEFNSCAVIVAHPDDETLWVGCTILMYPEANWVD